MMNKTELDYAAMGILFLVFMSKPAVFGFWSHASYLQHCKRLSFGLFWITLRHAYPIMAINKPLSN